MGSQILLTVLSSNKVYIMKLLTLLLMFFSTLTIAGDWTAYDTDSGNITKINVVAGQGVLIYGKLGDPSNCGMANYLWVPKVHEQYEAFYSMLMSAYMAGSKIHAYSEGCSVVEGLEGEVSTLISPGSLIIK